MRQDCSVRAVNSSARPLSGLLTLAERRLCSCESEYASRVIPQVPVATFNRALSSPPQWAASTLASRRPCSTILCKPDAGPVSAKGATWASASDLRACRTSRPSGPVLDARLATARGRQANFAVRCGRCQYRRRPRCRYATRPPCCAHSPLDPQPNSNPIPNSHLHRRAGPSGGYERVLAAAASAHCSYSRDSSSLCFCSSF